MAIDLLSIQPHKVSRDLSGYITYIYGKGGTGKTTLASQLDRALLLACEKGYNAIPGIMAQDITSWPELKQAVRQLKKPEVQEMYKSIVIDTVDLASDFCEKFICNNEEVEKLGDIPWGGGYRLMKKEFEEVFRTIAQMGYALFFISHDKDKVFKREDGTEYNQIVPSLASSSNEIIRNMSDIQGYAHQVKNEDGESQVMLTLRSLSGEVECKSRFKYIASEIPFNYEALSKALVDAIDKEAEENNNKFITNNTVKKTKSQKYDIKELKEEFQKMTDSIQKNFPKEEFASNWAPKIVAITTEYLGKGNRVIDCGPNQAEQVYFIINDLKELMSEGL